MPKIDNSLGVVADVYGKLMDLSRAIAAVAVVDPKDNAVVLVHRRGEKAGELVGYDGGCGPDSRTYRYMCPDASGPLKEPPAYSEPRILVLADRLSTITNRKVLLVNARQFLRATNRPMPA